MNGRIYDYNIGRFFSVDPFIQGTGSQGINPYSYVLNNPLSFTDPTGYTVEAEVDEVKTKKVAKTGSRLRTETETTTSGTVNMADGSSRKFSITQTTNSNSNGSATTVSISGNSGGGSGAVDIGSTKQTATQRAVEPGSTNVGGAPSDSSFNLFDPATYLGVEAGENAAMYWAQKHVDTGNPLYAVPGMFASLWTPSTAGDTALTLSGEGLFAIGAKVLQGIKGLRTTGALAGDVASTFRFGRYSEVTLAESKTLTRFYDNTNAFAKGRYMTDTSSLSSSTFLNRMGLALRPSWNGMTKQAHWTVPAGSTIYKGKAATQFPWIGGKTQYFVPNVSNVKRVSGN